jgi:hypothetical protein
VTADLAQALDRLRESVEALRSTIEETGRRDAGGPSRVYLDDLQSLHDRGRIDAEAVAEKKRSFLDKI